MRIDKFLNSVNITKRRSVAQDMINNNVVMINDKVVKASKNVEVGDTVTINYLNSSISYKVLQIPTTKTTPKSLCVYFPMISEFIKFPILTKTAPSATGITTRSKIQSTVLCKTFLLYKYIEIIIAIAAP